MIRAMVPEASASEQPGRPEPGTLARGVWEAPPWAFYAAAAVVVLGAVLYALRAARRAQAAKKL